MWCRARAGARVEEALAAQHARRAAAPRYLRHLFALRHRRREVAAVFVGGGVHDRWNSLAVAGHRCPSNLEIGRVEDPRGPVGMPL